MDKVRKIFRFSCQELWLIFKLVSPVYFTTLCTESIGIISVVFAGHISTGSDVLAAVTLCQLFTSLTGYFPHLCFSQSLDTLASQAFGAKKYKELGVLFQRSILIHLFMILPITIIWFNTANIMTVLNQSPQIIHIAAQYMLVYIFINPGYAILMPSMRLLQMQDIVLPSAVLLVLGILIEITLCYVLMFPLGLGVYGAALGPVIIVYALGIAHLLYIRFSSVWGRIWGGFSFEAWRHWGQYLYYGFPIFLCDLSELLSIQLGGFVVGIVGLHPEIEISVYSVVTYLDYIIYITPQSMGTVTAIRIGNLIGEGKLSMVKKVSALVVTTTVILSIIQSSVLMAGSHVWGNLFSLDPAVISGVWPVVMILAIYHPLDSLVAVFQGILRGSGKQNYSLIMAVGFFVIAFPLAIGLSVGLRLSTFGYWLGIMSGYVTRVCLWFIIIFCCIKWDNIRRVETVNHATNDVISSSPPEDMENRTNLLTASSTSNSYHSISLTPSSSNVDRSTYSIGLSRRAKGCIILKKLFVFSLFLFPLILMIICKYSSNRLNIYRVNSYLQAPVEICCFQFIPLLNMTNFKQGFNSSTISAL